MGTDGLWAKLKGQAQRVVLLVVDSVSGLVYPPVVAKGEESAGPWQRLFERAKQAGLDLDALRGVTSDGAQGLLAYLRRRPGLGPASALRLAFVAQLGRRTRPSRQPRPRKA